MSNRYDEIQGEIEDVEFGLMSIEDATYYEEVLSELSYADFDENGYIINDFTTQENNHNYNSLHNSINKNRKRSNILSSMEEYEETHTPEVLENNLSKYSKKYYNYPPNSKSIAEERKKFEILGFEPIELISLTFPVLVIVGFILLFLHV